MRVLTTTLLLVFLLVSPVFAYGTWDPNPSNPYLDLSSLDRVIDRLADTIAYANTNRLAHPDLLTDLNLLLDQFRRVRRELGQPTPPPPPQVIYIYDGSDDDYEWEVRDGRIILGRINWNSPYALHLQTGDQITAIDGIPYLDVPVRTYDGVRGRLTPLRMELLEGTRQEIRLTVSRGFSVFDVLLQPKVDVRLRIWRNVDDYEWELLREQVLINSVPRTSQYFGVLRAGDRIVAVNGIPYGRLPVRAYGTLPAGRLTPLRGELLDGRRPFLLLTIERGREIVNVQLLR